MAAENAGMGASEATTGVAVRSVAVSKTYGRRAAAVRALDPRRGALAGRTGELELFRGELLASEPSTSVLFVHGPWTAPCVVSAGVCGPRSSLWPAARSSGPAAWPAR